MSNSIITMMNLTLEPLIRFDIDRYCLLLLITEERKTIRKDHC